MKTSIIITLFLFIVACGGSGGGSSSDSDLVPANDNTNDRPEEADYPLAMAIGVTESPQGGYDAELWVADENKDVVQIEWSVYLNQDVYAGPDTVDVDQPKSQMTYKIHAAVELKTPGTYTFYFTAIDAAGHRSPDVSWLVLLD